VYSVHGLIFCRAGTIAYILGLALIFTRKFDNLSSYPLALTSLIIITIAGGPGKTVGSCVQGAALAMAGVLVGAGCFAILAKLGHVPVAQGFVFALYVYGKHITQASDDSYDRLTMLPISHVHNQNARPPMVCLFATRHSNGFQWGACPLRFKGAKRDILIMVL
jgi:hypothetical protein